jgi:dihydroxyacetone kinase
MMELMIATRKAVPELQLEHGVAVDRVYTGSFMTSLDMAGIFLTCLLVKNITASFCIFVNMLVDKRFLHYLVAYFLICMSTKDLFS